MSLTPRHISAPGALFQALLLVSGTASLIAQTNMGTVTGLVTDRSGAVLPGVTVTAKNTATGAEATTVQYRELPDTQLASGSLSDERVPYWLQKLDPRRHRPVCR